MDYIRYNDIFKELKQWLRPIDLYKLAQTCKSYCMMITMKDIKISTMHEIDRYLYEILGTDYDGFKLASKNSKGIIGGSLITQCILGEKWNDMVYIIVDSGELNHLFNEATGKYIFQEKDYKSGDVNNIKIIEYVYLKFSHLIYAYSTNNRITLCIHGKNIIIDALENIYEERQKYDVCKNIYMLGESFQHMYIHQINKIFIKQTNFIPDCVLHKKYRARGFSFYDADGKIVADRDIWKKMNIDIIKAVPYGNKTSEKRLQILYVEHGYIHENHILATYSRRILFSVNLFPISGGQIVSCFDDRKKDCLFQEMYPEVEHLHGFFGDRKTLFVINTCTDVDDPIGL
uniref:F-box domain-containing protein n=1 Tax=viral metagenome TaxID=1070528 RepID=A0A6C0C8J7_9ZZZZ